MTITKTVFVTAALLSAVVSLTACASAGASTGGSSAVAGGSTAVPAPTTSATSQAGDETPRADLQHERPLDWTRTEAVSAKQIRVYFVGSNPACYGVRPIVKETATTIQIGVMQGTLPEAPDACAQVAYDGSLLISLRKTIEKRTISHLQ